MIRRPLQWLSRRDDTELVMIGPRDFGLPEVPHTGMEWRAESEIADLRRLDVGLLLGARDTVDATQVLPQLVQYMALGIPPVATPLGSNATIIQKMARPASERAVMPSGSGPSAGR